MASDTYDIITGGGGLGGAAFAKATEPPQQFSSTLESAPVCVTREYMKQL